MQRLWTYRKDGLVVERLVEPNHSLDSQLQKYVDIIFWAEVAGAARVSMLAATREVFRALEGYKLVGHNNVQISVQRIFVVLVLFENNFPPYTLLNWLFDPAYRLCAR